MSLLTLKAAIKSRLTRSILPALLKQRSGRGASPAARALEARTCTYITAACGVSPKDTVQSNSFVSAHYGSSQIVSPYVHAGLASQFVEWRRSRFPLVLYGQWRRSRGTLRQCLAEVRHIFSLSCFAEHLAAVADSSTTLLTYSRRIRLSRLAKLGAEAVAQRFSTQTRTYRRHIDHQKPIRRNYELVLDLRYSLSSLPA